MADAMSQVPRPTPRQQAVLELFQKKAAAGEPPPTYGEIAAEFGWKSRNAAKRHVLELIRKGLLKSAVAGAPRGTSLAAPLVNRTHLIERLDGPSVIDLAVPPYMMPEQGIVFAFHQPNADLAEHHILENDLVFVAPKDTPVEVRLEVVGREGRPIVLPPGTRRRGRLVGVVVGTMRYYGALDD